ncbi:uncharacterized protein LOC134192702 [Corticium candelabrum]|uniref:uncharacterized protein LOC134192702 n=1 Tax=Corticium candelabrum TaxID=121492 RepID=UPI002E26E56A|nr:uncharacterized protein LOC134192702 [Corticium candelabrum]
MSTLLDAGNLAALVAIPANQTQRKMTIEQNARTNRALKAFEGPMSLSSTDITAEESLFSTKSASAGGQGNNFKVVVRIRPPIKRERDENAVTCVSVVENETVRITSGVGESQFADHYPGNLRSFVFDRVYAPDASQEHLYTSAVKPVVRSILKGYNGSIIAYGQTSTGKTYTIEGNDGDHRGIIPRTSEEIFNYIETQSDSSSRFLVRASFLQIYNEKLMDLLDVAGKRDKYDDSKADRLRIREAAGGGLFVDNLSEHVVKSPREILDLLKRGAVMRTTAQTKLNRESSRSHAVFSIIVEHSTLSTDTATKSVTIGKLNLVDLAGSERVKASGVQGKRLEEAMKINLSLSAFGKVILALTSPGQQHIPYRDSKLTRLLQDSLGGNCKTTLITTITPVSLHYSETVNSLKFANRAKSVKNYAIVNEDFSQQAMLSKYEQEIKKLRRALAEQQLGSDRLVVQEQLHKMQSQWAQVTKEKEDVESELARRVEEVEKTQQEKQKLQQKIEALEQEVLVGGTKVEETPEFEMAMRKAQEQLQSEYEERYRDLEREREALAKEKEELQAKQQELTYDRQLHSAGSSRLSDSPTSLYPDSTSLSHFEDQVQHEVDHLNSGSYNSTLEPYIRAMKDPETGITLKDRRYNFLVVKNGFTGLEAATWFIENLDGVESFEHAATIGQSFLDLGVFAHAGGSAVFIASDREVFSFSSVERLSSGRRVSVSGYAPSFQAPQRESSYTTSHSGQRLSSDRKLLSQPQSCALRSEDYVAQLSSTPAVLKSSSFASPVAADCTSDEDWGSSPLHEAAAKGDRSVVKSLIATFGLECTDYMGRTPLMYSVIANKVKCCELLIKVGANYAAQDRNGRTALLWAAYYGHGEMARMLIAKDKSVVEIADPDGRTAVHWATKPESHKVLEILSRHCGSEIINCQDDEQTTALHWSVLCHHPEHTRVLLQNCLADCTLTDREGRTAFHYGVSTNSLECLKMLLEFRPDAVNMKEHNGRTPLHLAVSNDGSLELVALLLSSPSCDSNSTDHRMTTPLHWAAVCNRPDVAKALLQRNANMMMRDTNGMTALHYATQKGFTECANILQRYGSTTASQQPSTPRKSHNSRPPPPPGGKLKPLSPTIRSLDVNSDRSPGRHRRSASLPANRSPLLTPRLPPQPPNSSQT